MTINEAIVKVANSYNGIKEIPHNKGWKNKPEFTREMKEMGWKVGEAWCMYFVKLCVYKAYLELGNEAYAKMVKDNLSGGVLHSLKKMKSMNICFTTATPESGAIGIMQNGDSQLGHAFIIYKIGNEAKQEIKTIEGNTDVSNGREGDGVYSRTRFQDVMQRNKLKLVTYVVFKD